LDRIGDPRMASGLRTHGAPIASIGIGGPKRSNKIIPSFGTILRRNLPPLMHPRKNDLFFRRFVIMLNRSIDSRMTWIRAEQFLRQTNDLLA